MQKWQFKTQQYCINKTISNIVLGVIRNRLANNHIIMIRQESKLLCPTKTIISHLQYNILQTANATPEWVTSAVVGLRTENEPKCANRRISDSCVCVSFCERQTDGRDISNWRCVLRGHQLG